MGGEAGCAHPGSGSTGVLSLPCPVRHGVCEVPDPQESALRDPSKVLLPEDRSRCRASAGRDRVAPSLDPAPAACDHLAPGAVGKVRGTRGDPFHASPGLEGSFAASELARLPARGSSVQGKGGSGLLTLRVLGVAGTRVPQSSVCGWFPRSGLGSVEPLGSWGCSRACDCFFPGRAAPPLSTPALCCCLGNVCGPLT